MPNSFDIDKMNDALCVMANSEDASFIADKVCLQMAKFRQDHVGTPNKTREEILSVLVDDMSNEVLSLNYLTPLNFIEDEEHENKKRVFS